MLYVMFRGHREPHVAGEVKGDVGVLLLLLGILWATLLPISSRLLGTMGVYALCTVDVSVFYTFNLMSLRCRRRASYCSRAELQGVSSLIPTSVLRSLYDKDKAH